ncbi:ACR090Cp [Eremothecium gossypii ATCC 10895]|uniref:ACR090Cp n=1 Tax=Eremothecium gossypii (strain ATCC 10895 / CBS 109.51 / FGSC 9923 / NRRL Y-1056) TaxID=284811 RepID=Q75C27_EREGS|nr:ACR090Cp [Eremothecium gossypii ATCC 10895]AAS51316.2 ACR090Cp [Eremothecium gossypii ATCC 10895]AEY95608.1 FACR090Cp [Eremothecium gossypii FDAG1]
MLWKSNGSFVIQRTISSMLWKRFYNSCSKANVQRRAPGRLPLVLCGVTALGAGCAAAEYHRRNYHAELSQEYFTKYKISYRKDIDIDHYLLELTPLKQQRNNIWALFGARNLWAVEIKQPEIMVVRQYTPLPLVADEDGEQLRALRDGDNGGGKLMLYIKEYGSGEVARWLRKLPKGHIVEVRGPYPEFEFPELDADTKRDREFLWGGEPAAQLPRARPFDIALFAAGTGIVTALQLLTTEDPFKGKIQLFYSCKSWGQLGPLGDLLRRCAQHDRVDLHVFESEKGESLRLGLSKISDLVSGPFPFSENAPFEQRPKAEPVLSLVCGPDDYIAFIAGPRHGLSQGPVTGLLGTKGWDNSNVYKLS